MPTTVLSRSPRVARIEQAVADIAAGKPVVVVGAEAYGGGGNLVFPAQKATTELLAFTVRHTSGFVCVALPGSECLRLDLPQMCPIDEDARTTAYTVTVDACGAGTGISAADRARTMRLLADPAARAADFTRPGHVVPIRTRTGGVLARPAHAEAAVDLAVLAGSRPVGVLCGIVSQRDNTTMAQGAELTTFAREHDLATVSIADLIAYRQLTETHADRVVETHMPLECGTFRALGYRNPLDDGEHIALTCGDIGDGEDVPVYVHSECPAGDVFGALHCDCRARLRVASAAVAEEGRGVVLYLRGRHGSGSAMLNSLRSCGLRERGADTVEARGHGTRANDGVLATQILRDLGVRSLRLHTDDPGMRAELQRCGVQINVAEPSVP